MIHPTEGAGGNSTARHAKHYFTAEHLSGFVACSGSLRSRVTLLCLVAAALGCGDELTMPDGGPPAAPAAIVIVGGDGQTDTVGQTLPDPLAVRVTDANNLPLKGQAVSFKPVLNGSGGRLIPDTAITDRNGRAEARWMLGATRGRQTARAEILTGSPTSQIFAEFSAVAAPANPVPPGAINITVQPSATAANTVRLPIQPRVRVLDAGGTPLDGAAVAVTVASGGGLVSGATTLLTDANGIATFTDLALIGPAGTYTLLFSAGSVSATSAAITVSAGPANAAHTTATVPDGAVGSPTTITVLAKDVSDNVTTGGATVVVRVSGANAATPPVTDHRDGTYIATYIPTSVGTDQVTITLDGTAIGGSPASSSVRAGSVSDTRSTLQASPVSLTASNGSSSSAITVTALDAMGNPVAGVDVALAATGSSNSFTPATATTDANGRVTSSFSSTASGPRTISATVDGVTLAQTQIITVDPDVADAGQTTANVPNGRENRATVITVQARDRFGNPLAVGGHTVVVTVTGTNPAGPITATDNGNGSYTASYTPSKNGDDDVFIVLDGVAIGGSPFRSRVR